MRPAAIQLDRLTTNSSGYFDRRPIRASFPWTNARDQVSTEASQLHPKSSASDEPAGTGGDRSWPGTSAATPTGPQSRRTTSRNASSGSRSVPILHQLPDPGPALRWKTRLGGPRRHHPMTPAYWSTMTASAAVRLPVLTWVPVGSSPSPLATSIASLRTARTTRLGGVRSGDRTERFERRSVSDRQAHSDTRRASGPSIIRSPTWMMYKPE